MASKTDTDGGGIRKSFDFRMSKKVAELTQVVHMLFTRNHEKEMEMEALRDAYEYEIELVQKDARTKIEVLEGRVQDLERQKSSNKGRDPADIEQLLATREAEWKKVLSEKESQLQWEKMECQSARDLLIQAQNDIEKLKGSQMDNNRKLKDDIIAKNQEIDKLKNLIASLEKQLEDCESDKANVLYEAQKERDIVQRSYIEAKDSLEGLKKTNEKLQDKIRQYEHEIRTLKAELAKRASSASPQKERRSLPSATFMDYNEEMDKLKRELQLCKMELCNREQNFNRMFTDKQPVLISGGSAKRHEGLHGEPVRLRMTRQKTFHSESAYSSTNGVLEHTEMVPLLSPRFRASSTGTTLPQLHMDTGRLQKLSKPRPLPKDFLSAKSAGHS